MVVFALSRNRCDKTAESLQQQNVELITSLQKENVKTFFKKSIKRLKGSDAQLPQVLKIEKLLEHGIGIHHSGILPILKEIVELLFQMGLVKVSLNLNSKFSQYFMYESYGIQNITERK